MIKLKELLTEARELPPKDIKMLAKLTDYNNHNEARIYLARKLGNKNLVKGYDAIMVLHSMFSQMNEMMKTCNSMMQDHEQFKSQEHDDENED